MLFLLLRVWIFETEQLVTKIRDEEKAFGMKEQMFN